MENQNAQKNDAPKPGPTKKKNRPSPDSGPNWKGTIGTFFLWIAIFGSFFFLYQIVSAGTDKHIE
ncbi:MAG TPA: hypothetical protein PLH27_10235, partial [bacterium]|nr:hypothetical protein [bacterium]